MTDVSLLDWISAEHQRRLEAVSYDWPTWLTSQLDAYWPNWREDGQDLQREYVEHILQQGEALREEESWHDTADAERARESASEFAYDATELNTDTGVATLAWVTEAQRQALEECTPTRGAWYTWLPAAFDQAWPEWRQSTDEVLGQWLDSIWPNLVELDGTDRTVAAIEDPLAVAADVDLMMGAVESPGSDPSASAVTPPDAVDASDLSWVTSTQAARLEALGDARGEWRQWLPDELDAIGEWRESAPGDLIPWLDLIIPTLQTVGTAERVSQDDVEATDDSQAATATSPNDLQATHARAAQELTVILAESLSEDPAMAALAARLTADELADLVAEAVLTPAGPAEGLDND